MQFQPWEQPKDRCLTWGHVWTWAHEERDGKRHWYQRCHRCGERKEER